MKVLVIVAFVHNSDDLQIVMVARGDDGTSMISSIVTIEGKARFASGNPYSVYGNACENFTGRAKFKLSITIAECTSGDLEGWE